MAKKLTSRPKKASLKKTSKRRSEGGLLFLAREFIAGALPDASAQEVQRGKIAYDKLLRAHGYKEDLAQAGALVATRLGELSPHAWIRGLELALHGGKAALKSFVESRVPLLQDQTPETRRDAARLLTRAGAQGVLSQKGHRALARLLVDKDEPLRALVAESIWVSVRKAPDPEALVPLLAEGHEASGLYGPLRALEGLSKAGVDVSAALHVLKQALPKGLITLIARDLHRGKNARAVALAQRHQAGGYEAQELGARVRPKAGLAGCVAVLGVILESADPGARLTAAQSLTTLAGLGADLTPTLARLSELSLDTARSEISELTVSQAARATLAAWEREQDARR